MGEAEPRGCAQDSRARHEAAARRGQLALPGRKADAGAFQRYARDQPESRPSMGAEAYALGGFLRSDLVAEELHDAGPRVFGGRLVVGLAGGVHERVLGTGVGLDVMRDAVLAELDVESAPRLCGEVVLGIGADHRAKSTHDIEWPRVDGIERGDRFQS